jgi:hypothetical protein
MSNPISTDRRFNKPTLESLVDLINFSNKTFIQYDQIEIISVEPINDSVDEYLNTIVVVRPAGTVDQASLASMSYGRLNLGNYLPEPNLFQYNGVEDDTALFQQLRQLHYIWLNADDCDIVISQIAPNGLRKISFIPKSDHPVWIGLLEVDAESTVGLSLA